MEKHPCVYIMANKPFGVLYIGVTSDLIKRVFQHRQGDLPGFTQRYRCHHLVYFEQHADMEQAILAEKKLKNLGRAKKLGLIERQNPTWSDLASSW